MPKTSITTIPDNAVLQWSDSAKAWQATTILAGVQASTIIAGGTQGQALTSKGTGTPKFEGMTTQGDIEYYSGTARTRLAPGTSGQFLKTQGASANPVWADNSAQPAWALIETLTWSANSSDQSFATFTAYDELMLKIQGITVGDLNLRINADSGANYSRTDWLATGSTTAQFSRTVDATSFPLVSSTNANAPFVGEWHICGKTTGGSPIPLFGNALHSSNKNGIVILFNGTWASASNITALTILVNSISTTMKAKLYGLNY